MVKSNAAVLMYCLMLGSMFSLFTFYISSGLGYSCVNNAQIDYNTTISSSSVPQQQAVADYYKSINACGSFGQISVILNVAIWSIVTIVVIRSWLP